MEALSRSGLAKLCVIAANTEMYLVFLEASFYWTSLGNPIENCFSGIFEEIPPGRCRKLQNVGTRI